MPYKRGISATPQAGSEYQHRPLSLIQKACTPGRLVHDTEINGVAAMLYAKMLPADKASFTDANDGHVLVCGHKIDFAYEDGKPYLHVFHERGENQYPISGDVFIMSESGKTISQFSPSRNMDKGASAEGRNLTEHPKDWVAQMYARPKAAE